MSFCFILQFWGHSALISRPLSYPFRSRFILVGETAIEDLVRLAKEDKSVLDVLAQYFDISKVTS